MRSRPCRHHELFRLAERSHRWPAIAGGCLFSKTRRLQRFHGSRQSNSPTRSGSRQEGVALAMIAELDILWITAGLSCDGDTIAMTAATQPSIEDIVLGAIPGVPKVNLHNPVLSAESGEDFMSHFHAAAEGRLTPFILVVEGSVPNENSKAEGYWAAMGRDRQTGEPITTCEWIDRLAPQAWAVVAAGTCATYGGVHAM